MDPDAQVELAFKARTFALTPADLDACKEIYPGPDLKSRLLVYDAKFAEKAEFAKASTVLEWLRRDVIRDAERQPATSSFVQPAQTRRSHETDDSSIDYWTRRRRDGEETRAYVEKKLRRRVPKQPRDASMEESEWCIAAKLYVETGVWCIDCDPPPPFDQWKPIPAEVA